MVNVTFSMAYIRIRHGIDGNPQIFIRGAFPSLFSPWFGGQDAVFAPPTATVPTVRRLRAEDGVVFSHICNGEKRGQHLWPWGFPWPWGYPNSWMVYYVENPIEIDDLEVPPFQETSIWN